MIIDFHTHTFPPKIAAGVLRKLQGLSRSKPYTDGTPDGLRRSMQSAGIDLSVLLPVMTNTAQVRKLNDSAARMNEKWQETGLFSLGGMHPDCTEYREELARVKELGIPGIKIHPAYQNVDFDDIRFLRIIDRASELGLFVITHAGWDIGIPHHNFCSVPQVKRVMREVAPDQLVLAHMGGWWDWRAVEEELCGLPLYLDTAFSIGKIEPAPGTTRTPEESSNLSREDFVRMVRKHGIDRVLFATDCPWSDQAEYLGLLRAAGFTEEEQTAILGENARRLLRCV